MENELAGLEHAGRLAQPCLRFNACGQCGEQPGAICIATHLGERE
jgi:hypothetical protein